MGSGMGMNQTPTSNMSGGSGQSPFGSGFQNPSYQQPQQTNQSYMGNPMGMGGNYQVNNAGNMNALQLNSEVKAKMDMEIRTLGGGMIQEIQSQKKAVGTFARHRSTLEQSLTAVTSTSVTFSHFFIIKRINLLG